jgi:hypothetical protein
MQGLVGSEVVETPVCPIGEDADIALADLLGPVTDVAGELDLRLGADDHAAV